MSLSERMGIADQDQAEVEAGSPRSADWQHHREWRSGDWLSAVSAPSICDSLALVTSATLARFGTCRETTVFSAGYPEAWSKATGGRESLGVEPLHGRLPSAAGDQERSHGMGPGCIWFAWGLHMAASGVGPKFSGSCSASGANLRPDRLMVGYAADTDRYTCTER